MQADISPDITIVDPHAHSNDFITPLLTDSKEEFVRRVRLELDHRGLEGWQVFGIDMRNRYFANIDRYVAGLGDPEARWQPHHGSALRQLNEYEEHGDKPWAQSDGVIHLKKSQVLVVRWKAMSAEMMAWVNIEFVAVPSVDEFSGFIDRLRALHAGSGLPRWLAMPGIFHEDEFELNRSDAPGIDDLVLSESVRRRIEHEAVSFFKDEVRELHTQLKVPYRRGILMYGPPGCGKTSICRSIGAALPDVKAYILNVNSRFDTDDLRNVFREVTRSAPAILVMEDVDLLLERPQISVSVFLNMMDGIVPAKGDGVLVLATTNHPEDLVGAVNNRPGRFTTIEIPSPTLEQRRDYLQAMMPEIDQDAIDSIVRRTEHHSFAHLREIIFLSGVYAMSDGERCRTIDTVLKAADVVVDCAERAEDGFKGAAAQPFGFSS